MTNITTDNLKRIKIPLLVFLISLLIRLPFTSSSTYAWDSNEYLKWCYEYHELGATPTTRLYISHPLYFFLIYVASLLGSVVTGNLNFEKSGIFVSVLFGSLSVIPMYYIALYLFRNEIFALISSLLFSFCPVIWFLSEELMTDVPSICIVLSGFAFILKWFNKQRMKYLIISSVFIGLSFLIRISNYFILPVYFMPVFINSYKRKTLKPIIISSIIIVPYLLYILFNVFVKGVSLEFLFTTTEQVKMFFSRLVTIETWAIFIKIMISTLTITLSSFLLVFIYIYITGKFYKNNDNNKNLKFSFLFIILWILPYLIIWRTFTWDSQHLRLIIILIPPMILMITYVIVWLINNYSNNILLTCLGITIIGFFIVTDHLLMYHIQWGISDLIKNFIKFIIENGYLFFIKIVVILAVLYSFSYFVISKISKITDKKEKDNLILKYITVLLLIHLTIYTVPLLVMNHNKIVYEKAEALWLAENTPSDSVLIGGHEFPFYQVYAKPRRVINMWYLDNSINFLKNLLVSGKRIFVCSNDFIEEWKTKSGKIFIFQIVGKIGAEKLRNQADCDFHFLNYVTYKKAYDIIVYELKYK